MTGEVGHSESSLSPPSPDVWPAARFLIIAVAAGLLTAAVLQADPLQSANDRSRWATVWSLAERGTYHIDEIDARPAWQTIDKVRHEGHFYSTKPPLLPTLVAGVYWTTQRITGWNLLDDTQASARTVLFIVNVIPFVIALILLARWLDSAAQTNTARLFVLTTAAVGTLLTTFSTTFNNHTVAALSTLFALYAAYRILAEGSTSARHFALAGFFAAFTCTVELPAALFGLAMFFLLLRTDVKRTLTVFVPAALVPLVAFFVTNYLATGGWKPFYLYYGEKEYLFIHEGIPSYWMQPRGIDANRESPWMYLLHCTLGHHGVLSLSPVFVVTVLAWSRLSKYRGHALRPFLQLGLALSIVILGFYLTRTQNYNYGGQSAGLRWMLWLIPFWLLAMIPLLDEWADCRKFRAASCLALGLSVFSVWSSIDAAWRHPWLYNRMTEWGWIDYDKRETPDPFDPPLTTWFRSLPKAGANAWVEFAEYDETGQAGRLRLVDGGNEEVDGKTVRKLLVEMRRSGSSEAATATYHIDEAAFRSGAAPEKFLVWPDDRPNAAARQAARTFFRGLPWPMTYRSGYVRYLKTPLRTNAFTCRRAAATVNYRPTESHPYHRYRSDLWLSNDVPFGVVRFETTVTESDSGELVSKKRYTVVATGTDATKR
jgi:hypothetical protein